MRHVSNRNPAGALVLCAALLGCAGIPDQPRPAWIDNPSVAPAPSGWWTAVGQGRTRADAIDAAMVRLAQRVESRVVAVERFTEDTTAAALDRRARITTDARLLGAEVVRTHRDRADRAHYAVVALDPDAAGRVLGARARAQLAVDPPLLSPELGLWIEQGALLAPGAEDWDDLRLRYARLVMGGGPGTIDTPPAVAAALRERFGRTVTDARWNARGVASYHPGESIVAWRLDARVAGVDRVWTGTVRGGGLAEAQRLAAAAADRAVRTDEGIVP